MDLIYRHADESDIPVLIKMLSDDSLGKLREDTSPPANPCYLEAMQQIQNDPNNELTVVEGSGEIVGMLQLTFNRNNLDNSMPEYQNHAASNARLFLVHNFA